MDKEQYQKQMRKRNRLTDKELKDRQKRIRKKENRKILLLSACIVALIYIGLSFVRNIGGLKVFYTTAHREVVVQDKILTGFIIREEMIHKASSDGFLHIIKDEGVSVLRGTPICSILSKDDVELQKDNIDVVEIEELVPPSLITEGDNSDEKENEISIASMLTKGRATVEEENTEPKVQFSYTLKKLGNSNGRSLSSHINSEGTGMLSFLIDGFESTFSKQNVETMTLKDFENLKEQVPLSYAKPPEQVSTGDEVFKIISNETWGIVTFLDEQDAAAYEEGEHVQVTFTYPEQIFISMDISYKETKDGITKLIFETNDYLSRTAPFRKVEFQIGDPIREGLSVPEEAVTERVVINIPNEYIKRERNYLIVYRENETIENVAVDFLYKKQDQVLSREMAVIRYNLADENRIKEGDVLVNSVTNERFTVKSLEIETGVYVVNGKVAEFKKVDPVLYKNGQVIVSENSSELKELDRVICNPKNFGDGELLTNLELVVY